MIDKLAERLITFRGRRIILRSARQLGEFLVAESKLFGQQYLLLEIEK